MIYTTVDDYDRFACLASECPATCCEGWQIMIDAKTLKKYRNCRGAFGSRLANSIDWKERRFKQYHGRCAFLNEQNLCDIHIEAGADLMCSTCRKYPRHIEVFENEREISLSLSCPAVARMLLRRQEKMCFKRWEKDGEETDPEFDDLLYSALRDSRELLIRMAQNREETLELRMAKILSLAHDVQNRISARRLFEVESVLERYQREGAGAALARKLEWYVGAHCLPEKDSTPVKSADEATSSVPGEAHREAPASELAENGIPQLSEEEFLVLEWRLLDYLRDLEVLDEAWSSDLQEWRQLLYGKGPEWYAVKKQEFRRHCCEWETEYEQLLVYFLFTYFCGAAYDGDALVKTKMAVVSVLILRELAFAVWLQQGEVLAQEDRERIAWRYSRELEHSDQNLNTLERMLDEWDEADFEPLLLLLLYPRVQRED